MCFVPCTAMKQFQRIHLLWDRGFLRPPEPIITHCAEDAWDLAIRRFVSLTRHVWEVVSDVSTWTFLSWELWHTGSRLTKAIFTMGYTYTQKYMMAASGLPVPPPRMGWVQNLRFSYIFMEPAKTHGIYTVLTSSASETVVFAAFCNTTLYTTTLIVLLLQKQQQLLLLLPLLRTTTYYYVLLRTTTYYYVLLRTSYTYYYVLRIRTTTYFVYVLLRTTYYYVLLRTILRTTTYYYVLLRTTTYHYVLLRTTTYYVYVLRTTTYYYVLRTTYYVLLRTTYTYYVYVLRICTTYTYTYYVLLAGDGKTPPTHPQGVFFFLRYSTVYWRV